MGRDESWAESHAMNHEPTGLGVDPDRFPNPQAINQQQLLPQVDFG